MNCYALDVNLLRGGEHRRGHRLRYFLLLPLRRHLQHRASICRSHSR